jgi:glycosyltransferase involved in cell wall biosynthesis
MTLVCLAEIAWGYFRTRKQFLLSRLAKLGWRVIYFEPIAFGRGGGFHQREEDGVTVITVPFLKPGTRVGLYNAVAGMPWGRRGIEAAATRSVHEWIRRLEIEKPVVMTSNIYAVRAIPAFKPSFVFYDFNDHPMQFPTAPPWAGEYLERTLRTSELAIAVSEPYLVELKEMTGAPVVLIENGVEFDHFADPTGRVPEQQKAVPRPRIGYLGKLSSFLDLELLEKLAGSGLGSLVLAGPIPAEMRLAIRRLTAREDVYYLGEVPYGDVPALFASWDVGLIPFRAGDRFTENINPNKLYQYFAAGLPVVSSPIVGMNDDPRGLCFGATHGEYIDAVKRALDAPPEPAQIQSMARDHDWDRLAEKLDSTIRDHVQEKERASGQRQR